MQIPYNYLLMLLQQMDNDVTSKVTGSVTVGQSTYHRLLTKHYLWFFLELYPIVVASILQGKQWSDKRIVFNCDYQATVHIITKGRCKEPVIMKLMRRLTIVQHSTISLFTVLMCQVWKTILQIVISFADDSLQDVGTWGRPSSYSLSFFNPSDLDSNVNNLWDHSISTRTHSIQVGLNCYTKSTLLRGVSNNVSDLPPILERRLIYFCILCSAP